MNKSHSNEIHEPKNVTVPVKMYSKSAILTAMHISSNRWLAVNVSRNVLTFHGHRDGTDSNSKSEVPISQIRCIRGDLSHAEYGKFYLTVIVGGDEFKFKFKNARDFYAVVDNLRKAIAGIRDFSLKEDSSSPD